MELYKKIAQLTGMLTMLFTPVYFFIEVTRLSGLGNFIMLVITSLAIFWGGWTAIIIGEIIESIENRGDIEQLQRQVAELRKRIPKDDSRV